MFVQLTPARMVNMEVHVTGSVLITVRLPGVVKMMVNVNVKMVIMDWDVNRSVLLTVVFLYVIKTMGLVADVSMDSMAHIVTKHVLYIVNIQDVISRMVTVNVMMDIMERAVNGVVPRTVIILVIKPQGHVLMAAKTAFMVLTAAKHVLNIVNILDVNKEMVDAYVTMVISE